jgi:hypothetical protein
MRDDIFTLNSVNIKYQEKDAVMIVFKGLTNQIV